MTQNAKRADGCEYLYQRGRRYVVRVQVPRALRKIVGSGELKKSLGGDLLLAKRAYHAKVAEFLQRIEAARRGITKPSDATGIEGHSSPSATEIEAACFEHFRQMDSSIRGKVSLPTGENPSSRANRVKGYRAMIENHLDIYEADAWSTMSAQADWLCDDMGWEIDHSSKEFEHLCRTMLRARLQSYRNELRRLEGKMADDPDADPLFGSRPLKRKTSPRTLGELRRKFEEERDKLWSASTRKNYSIIFRVLDEVCGSETPLSEIDRDFCMDVMVKLELLPAHYQKCPQTRGKPIDEAIAIAKREGMPTIGAATINNHLNKLGAIVRFGRDRGWITGNPMAGIEVPDDIDASEKRDAFSIEQLNLIFARPPWNSGWDIQDERPSRYWGPLIALFTGARLTEICGQRVDEMIVENGVHLFHFLHRPNDRHIKNGKSRKVPVHPQLMRLGFWEFVEQARASDRDHLFPDTKRDKLGKWGDHTTKWFSRQVKALDLKGRNLSFHSFRHTFEDALRSADLHGSPIGDALTGRWTAGVSKNYGSKYPVVRLKTEIAKVKYEGLEISHLTPLKYVEGER